MHRVRQPRFRVCGWPSVLILVARRIRAKSMPKPNARVCGAYSSPTRSGHICRWALDIYRGFGQSRSRSWRPRGRYSCIILSTVRSRFPAPPTGPGRVLRRFIEGGDPDDAVRFAVQEHAVSSAKVSADRVSHCDHSTSVWRPVIERRPLDRSGGGSWRTRCDGLCSSNVWVRRRPGPRQWSTVASVNQFLVASSALAMPDGPGRKRVARPIGLRHAYRAGDEQTLCGLTVRYLHPVENAKWSPRTPQRCTTCETATTTE